VPELVSIRVDDPLLTGNAVVVVTLKEGAAEGDLADYIGEGTPPFVDEIVAHVDPDPEGVSVTQTVLLAAGQENYVLCAAPDRVLDVVASFIPRG